ncbi:Ig-like domain-containing protein, partial [Aeromonas simiae]|uniref:Ig-like domain-containing protein n=1 Tax=Aeromonas simiae TaxID=218936 RepID=UPI0018DD609E
VTLPMGPTQQFQVLAIYSDGSDSDVTTQAAWQSSHPNIVQIDSTGVARSLAAGEATITATFGGLSAHADVTVPPTTLSSLTIDPASLSFPKGIKQQIKAWATYSDDSTIDVTTQVDWSSAEPDVVGIDDKGIVTGLASGNAVIIATLGELSANAEVFVTDATLSHLAISPETLSLPKGIKQPLLALATYSDGRIIDVTAQAAWQSSDAQIVAIQRANRARFDAPVVAIGLASGSVKLTAHFGEQAASIEEATITPATLNRLVITPDTLSLPIGGTQPLQVQAIYTDNSLFDVTNQAEWRSADPDIIDVDTDGLATGRASGSVALTAQFDGHTTQTHPRVLRPGRVVTWEERYSGGDNSDVAEQLENVKTIFSTDSAFAALLQDGSVVSWGSNRRDHWHEDNGIVQPQLKGVQTIFSTRGAFAALLQDGSVATWGDPYYGGDSSSVQLQLNKVKTIFSNTYAFAALKQDGSVVTWGMGWSGGDSSAVQSQLTHVKQIFNTYSAFAALKQDGSVVTWGYNQQGGDSSSVQPQLNNVQTIFCNASNCAALKQDSSVVTWGGNTSGWNNSVQPPLKGCRPSLVQCPPSPPCCRTAASLPGGMTHTAGIAVACNPSSTMCRPFPVM